MPREAQTYLIVSRFGFSLNSAFVNKYSIYNIWVFREKDNPHWWKIFKRSKKWKFTNISPFCWSFFLVFSADEIWDSPWLLIPFSILLPASVWHSSYGDQTMRLHFEMIDDLSFWKDIQIYNRWIKGETIVSKWCRLSLWNDGWLSLRNEDMTVCSICDKGFFSLCLLSKGQSFVLSYEKDRISANERAFRKDSNSLKDIEIWSFQKERLLSQANVLILI